MQLTKTVFAFVILFALVATANAQDNDRKTKKQLERVTKNVANQMMNFFKPAELTDEQKEKAVGVIKKHAEKLMKARMAQDKMLSDEQKNARKEALAKAKKEGLKGAKMVQAGMKAMNLSEADMKAFNEAKKKVTEVMNGMKAEVTAMLSDDQKAAMKKARKMPGKKGKGKKAKGKKKDGGDGQ